MKKLLIFLLMITLSSTALAVPKIDRSKKLLYPTENVRPVDRVYVCIESGYAYHHRLTCDTEKKILKLTKDDFVEMTKYEAMLREFFECPDCSDDLDYYDIDNLDDIKFTVDDISDNLDELIDFLIALFTQ